MYNIIEQLKDEVNIKRRNLSVKRQIELAVNDNEAEMLDVMERMLNCIEKEMFPKEEK